MCIASYNIYEDKTEKTYCEKFTPCASYLILGYGPGVFVW